MNINTAIRHTVVVVGDSSITRVIFATNDLREVEWSTRLDRPEHLTLGESVEVAFDDGPQRGGSVWVLTDEVWSGRVALESRVAKAIPSNQLSQTLALQAEEESGISPFDSRLGHVDLPKTGSGLSWWVTQAEEAQVEEVVESIPRSAGKLAGLASMSLLPEPDKEGFECDQDESHEELARKWLSKLMSAEASLPFIAAEAKAVQSANPFQNAWIVAAILFAFTTAIHVHGERRLKDTRTEMSRMVRYEKQLRKDVDRSEEAARLALDAQKMDKKYQMAEQENLSRLLRAQTERSAAAKRPSLVLRILEETAGKDHWIQEVELIDRKVTLCGLAMDCLTVSNLLERLELEFGSLLSRIQPSEMSASPSNGVVHFELRLTLAGVVAAPLDTHRLVHGRSKSDVL